MPDLRTPAIRLADALDRIAELEGCVMKNAESFQKVLDVAMRAEDRIDELEAENKRLATLLADRENAAPPQPPSAPQTARALHRYPDSPEVHTGLWRALRAGRGQVR